MTQAVVKIFPERATDPMMTLSAKQPQLCGPLEFSFFDVPAGDVDFLVTEVFKAEDGEVTGDLPVAFPAKK